MIRILPDLPRALVLGSALLVLSAAAALADQASPNHITREAAVQAVLDAGYTDPHDVDFDNDTPNGEWELEAFDSTGKKFDIEVDATTGAILKAELDD